MTMPMFEGGNESVRDYLRDNYSEEMVTEQSMTVTFGFMLDAEAMFCPIDPKDQRPIETLNRLGGMLSHVLSPRDAARIEEIKKSLGQ